jgi:hypothetical protein
MKTKAEYLAIRTTIKTITRDQIKGLRLKARAAGDTKQVAICDAALEHDPEALAECVRVISDAEARV